MTNARHEGSVIDPQSVNHRSSLLRLDRWSVVLASLAWSAMSAAPAPPSTRTSTPILVSARDEVVVQRTFTPWSPRTRLDTAAVGTPSGVHFIYDFETGAILRAWRGDFLDAREMWDGRGLTQFGRPVGPAVTLGGSPLLTFDEAGAHEADSARAWQSRGYVLEVGGFPVFLAAWAGVQVEDRIVPALGGGLRRTLRLSGRLPVRPAHLLLAEADKISLEEGEGTETCLFTIGDRAWRIEFPRDVALRPVVRAMGERQELVLSLTPAAIGRSIVYSIGW